MRQKVQGLPYEIKAPLKDSSPIKFQKSSTPGEYTTSKFSSYPLKSGEVSYPDKYLAPRFLEDNHPISTKSAAQILSWFTLLSDFYTYSTCWSNLSCLDIPPYNTKPYGRNSVNIKAIYTRNYLQKLNENNLFDQLSPSKLKIIIKKFFLNNCS